ncbi:MAG TPA: 4-(cytidine 5'-diphospho)-2-C-methyl-D-erythritol kinase [Acidimicrobiales bacterium]|nr:4-(cytidine 5'-diphospho)-2-C-methyl-D-erythritol kinase [Acidimicrobiales bacterium]
MRPSHAPDDDEGVARATSTVLRAPAKLTRQLRVTGRRGDGYHLLDAEMVAVDLYDDLEITAGASTSLDVVDAVDWVGPEGESSSPPDGSDTVGPNLVAVALDVCGRTAQVRLTKRIPAGAGLGGGSSDAAAVLRWAGCRDLAVAAQIGADVPFCLDGGRARVGGIGELIEPLDYEPTDFLLVVPRLHVSTPAVYSAWDLLDGPKGEHGNDLEVAALVAEPGLGWWRDLIAAVAGQRPMLAGSGGTWWIEGERSRLESLEGELLAAIGAEGEAGLVKLVRAVPAY